LELVFLNLILLLTSEKAAKRRKYSEIGDVKSKNAEITSKTASD
jgi:hypothetical protein